MHPPSAISDSSALHPLITLAAGPLSAHCAEASVRGNPVEV
jgi:hypothetical protein